LEKAINKKIKKEEKKEEISRGNAITAASPGC